MNNAGQPHVPSEGSSDRLLGGSWGPRGAGAGAGCWAGLHGWARSCALWRWMTLSPRGGTGSVEGHKPEVCVQQFGCSCSVRTVMDKPRHPRTMARQTGATGTTFSRTPEPSVPINVRDPENSSTPEPRLLISNGLCKGRKMLAVSS